MVHGRRAIHGNGLTTGYRRSSEGDGTEMLEGGSAPVIRCRGGKLGANIKIPETC